MLALARWLMRGMPYAAAGAALANVVWLFWLGAAIAALVTLRKGFAPALPVFVAAAVPAGWWWVQGDAIPLASLLLTTLMAVVLRARVRWSETLLVAMLATAAMVQLGLFNLLVDPNVLIEQMRQSSAEVDGMLTSLTELGYDPAALAVMIVGGVTGLMVLLSSTLSLALARGWQAGLYNPGGFREEFHAFRFTPRELLVLVVLNVVGLLLGAQSLAMIGWVPLLVAGIALVHGYIGLKGMSGLWLVAFYALLVTTWPTILIVLLLGFVDTFANIRARLSRSN
ncbi:hypothetical protein [Halomonas dongshanensis]|uniref:DUF2232 domain-containing protein n=1 Tax=Halomonas dongshanensis TaxID=2890835 RepID=A0ABT2ED72_9GAMM|nr:hypothetical protein [Halomonas dongshanensis]MCS2609495.1 hypothetical protein [Halomonas dongshanensis]